jgi:hypothetical protein
MVEIYYGLKTEKSITVAYEQALTKTLLIRVRIFNVCQEHFTGFNLTNQSHSS